MWLWWLTACVTPLPAPPPGGPGMFPQGFEVRTQWQLSPSPGETEVAELIVFAPETMTVTGELRLSAISGFGPGGDSGDSGGGGDTALAETSQGFEVEVDGAWVTVPLQLRVPLAEPSHHVVRVRRIGADDTAFLAMAVIAAEGLAPVESELVAYWIQ